MLFFGHLGIGATLVRPWRDKLPFRWVLLGAVLPDLIDKPLYYGLSWATGKRSGDLGLISCTHTFGHTGMLVLLLALAAAVGRSPVLAAVAAGDATHVLIDNFPGALLGNVDSNALALMYPFYSTHFGLMLTHNLQEHLTSLLADPYILVSEVLGLLLLYRLWQTDRAWMVPGQGRAGRTLDPDSRNLLAPSQTQGM